MLFPSLMYRLSSIHEDSDVGEIKRNVKTVKELFYIMRNLQNKLEQKREIMIAEEDPFNKKIRIITRRLRDDFNYIKELQEHQIRTGIQVNMNKVMSEMEIDFINKYFTHCNSNPQIMGMIDQILKGLKFFKRMNKPNRRDIVVASKLKIIKQGEYIIRQGDIGDNMYIILKG
jgi:hypothetical protein